MTSAMLLFAVCLDLVLPPGTAESPSAVVPLTPSEEPVAFWYDADALHVGTNALTWKALKVAPADGASFKTALPGNPAVTLALGLDKTAPRLRMGSFGAIGGRAVSNRVEVLANADIRLSSRLLAYGPRPDYLRHNATRTIKAGTTGVFDVVGKAPPSGRCSYALVDEKGKPYYRSGADFHAPGLLFDFKCLWADPEKNCLHVKTGGWTDRSDYRLRLSFYDLLSDTIKAWACEQRIGDLNGEKVFDFDVTPLQGGFYRVHVDYLDAAGKVVHSDKARLAKPAEPMPWVDTALGDEDTVPPPWSQPTFGDDGTVKVWGREIKLGGKGVVEQITNGGTPYLAAPATYFWEGKPLTFSVALKERKRASATYRLQAREAPVEVEAYCEFDGYVRLSATYCPPVSSLDWVIPVDRRHVAGFDDCSVEGNPDVLIPKTGTWRRTFNPDTKPIWWMPGRVGLMGGVYNLHGTHIRNLDSAVSVEAQPRQVEVRTRFVDEPLAAGARRTIRHYVEPTPVKPKNRMLASLPADRAVAWTGHLCDFFEMKYPGFDDQLRFKRFRDDVKAGKRVFFYVGTCGASPEEPIWNWYQRDWTTSVPGAYCQEAPIYTEERRQHGNWTYACIADKGFFEYKLWGVNWYLHAPAPEAKDLYFDLANPHQCHNRTHPCVWQDDFGRTRFDWSTEATRELHKRAYRLVKAKHADGLMRGHIGCRQSPGAVFFDSISTGEALMPRMQKNYNYYELLTPEMMQSYYVPRAQEMVVNAPPQFRRSRECLAPHLLKSYDPREPETDRAIRHFAAYMLIHDVQPRGYDGPQYARVEGPICALGASVEHVAYYHEGTVPVTLSSPGPRQLWAYFHGAGKGVLILLNDTDETVEQRVTVRGVASKGRELLANTRYDFTSGTCAVTLGPRAAKFIEFGAADKR
ncbi:MAG: hypothetical protein MJ240_06960 [Kiritimatiellae bacterium]|nr:hypothetical protein [Kiritimatiellia bacterium]